MQVINVFLRGWKSFALLQISNYKKRANDKKDDEYNENCNKLDQLSKRGEREKISYFKGKSVKFTDM